MHEIVTVTERGSGGHPGQPLLDPCSPFPPVPPPHESSPKHVCSCQLPSVCVNLWRVCMYTVHVFRQRALLHIFNQACCLEKGPRETLLQPLFPVNTNFSDYKEMEAGSENYSVTSDLSPVLCRLWFPLMGLRSPLPGSFRSCWLWLQVFSEQGKSDFRCCLLF